MGAGRKPLPPGTIRVTTEIVNRQGRRVTYQRARIKLETGEWTWLAAHVYQQHHGPIPDGWVVTHRDGDSLNNTPANLHLVRRGDIILEQVNEIPKRERWRRTRLSQGLRLHHKTRRAVQAALVFENSDWYPVDTQRHLIILDPARRSRLLTSRYPVTVHRNGRQSPQGPIHLIRGTDLINRGCEGWRRIDPEEYQQLLNDPSTITPTTGPVSLTADLYSLGDG